MGGLVPEYAASSVVAAALMLGDIGTIGVLTGSIATHFPEGEDRASDPDVEHARPPLATLKVTSVYEREHVDEMLTLLASRSVTSGHDK